MNTTHLLRSAAATLVFVIVLQTSMRASCAGPPLEPQSSCANVTRDFVRSAAPRNDRYLDFFRACGNLESLELLMGGLAKTNGPRDPLELFAAIDATLNSPTLKNNTEATALLARTVPTIPDSRHRAIFVQMLGRRGASATLIALLQHDPSAAVRTAATEALAQSSAPFDDAILFEVARNDKDAGVRAKAWLALEYLNRLHDRTDRLIALNAQSDGFAIARLFHSWLASGKASSPSAYATQLVELARDGSVNQSIGALAAITAILDADSAPMPLVRHVPLPPAPPAPAAAAHDDASAATRSAPALASPAGDEAPSALRLGASSPAGGPAASQVRRALETQRDRIARRGPESLRSQCRARRSGRPHCIERVRRSLRLRRTCSMRGRAPHPAHHGPPAGPACYRGFHDDFRNARRRLCGSSPSRIHACVHDRGCRSRGSAYHFKAVGGTGRKCGRNRSFMHSRSGRHAPVLQYGFLRAVMAAAPVMARDLRRRCDVDDARRLDNRAAGGFRTATSCYRYRCG